MGDGEQPFTTETADTALDEIESFASVLETAIAARDLPVIELAVDTVGHEWRELGENFPDHKNTAINGGLPERLAARQATVAVALSLRRVAMAADSGDFDEAGRAYAEYRSAAATAASVVKRATPWSLFNPAIRDRHFAALHRLEGLAGTPSMPQAGQPRR